MNSLAAILAPFGLLFPGASGPLHPDAVESRAVQLTEQAALAKGSDGRALRLLPKAYLPFLSPQQTPIFEQVRIEQRVIIRIAPRPGPLGQNATTLQPQRSAAPRYQERPLGNCLTTQSIAGVRAESGNRLLLFLRDRRMVFATLEKACSAGDFYSGFYMENSRDGQLCVDRDQLHARNGAKCQVSRLSHLVRVVE